MSTSRQQLRWWMRRGGIALLAGLVAFVAALYFELGKLRDNFTGVHQAAADHFESSHRTKQSMLAALATVQQATLEFEPGSISTIAESVRKGNPGLALIAYASWVPREQEQEFVRHMREQGFPMFAVAENEQHRIVGDVVGRLLVRFIEPSNPRYLSMLGRSVMHSPELTHEVDRLVRSNRAGHLPGFMDAGVLRGLVFYATPVYRGYTVPETHTGRLQQFDGMFIFGVDPGKMLQRLSGQYPNVDFRFAPGEPRRNGVHLTVFNGETSGLLALVGEQPVLDAGLTLALRQIIQPVELITMPVLVLTLSAALAGLLLVFAWQKREEIRQEVMRKERELEEERRRADGAMRSISDAVLILDDDWKVRYLNPVAEKLLDQHDNRALGKKLEQVMGLCERNTGEPVLDTRGCIASMMMGEMATEALLEQDDKTHVPVDIRVSELEGFEFGGLVVAIRDVSQELELSSRLAFHASHDNLTGLLNRASIEEEVRRARNSTQDQVSEHALIFLDVDRFKLLNDTYGHQVCDDLIVKLAGILSNSIRAEDRVGRMGGDEFALLARNSGPEEALDLALRLRNRIQDEGFFWQGKRLDVRTSIGVVSIKHDGGSFETLWSHADMACRAAKGMGGNAVYVYRPGDALIGQHKRDVEWLPRLQQALERQEFELFRQPIWAVGGPEDRPPIYEFLLRLRDSDGKILAPGQFMPCAERFELMHLIDREVIRLAMRAMASPVSMPVDVMCTINLSGQSLSEKGLLEYILGQARENAVEPRRVSFEVTETVAIANMGVAQEMLSALRERGFRVMLDDFGAGMSSLGYLHQLEVDFIKIDGHFVRHAASDPLSAVSVRMVCEIAEVLGVQTIAEMIEDQETVDCMRNLGVDYLQGFYLGKPESLPGEETAPARLVSVSF